MLIKLGLWLDEKTNIPPSTISSGGVLVVGLSGFVSYLEDCIGLACDTDVVEVLRVEQYRLRLKACLSEAVFYAASYEVDALETARAVLALRDELVLGGWNLDAIGADAPPRLQVLRQLEQTTEYPLSSGFADRYAQVWQALAYSTDEDITLPFDTIELADPLGLLPLPLVRLLTLLRERKGVRVLDAPALTSCAQAGTDLHVLQTLLLTSSGQTMRGHLLTGDGSLGMLCAQYETDAASYLAKLIRLNGESVSPCYLIPQKSRVLDQAFIMEGLPSMGIPSASLARPTLQIIKLMDAFLWEPIDPFKIMEFVSLAIKPLHDELATVIANVMAETPGIHGERWNRDVYHFFDTLEARAATDTNIDVQKVRGEYSFWFERKRYPAGGSIPRSEPIALYSYIHRWARKAYDSMPDTFQSLLVLAEQARRVCDILEALPDEESTLTALRLERIVRSIYQPAPVVFVPAQKAHAKHVFHEGGIVEPEEEILWWGFQRTLAPPLYDTWRLAERQYLYAHGGVLLDTPTRRLEVYRYTMLLPIMRCRKRLLLVYTSMYGGSNTDPHFLNNYLEAIFDNWKQQIWYIDRSDTPPQWARTWALPTTLPLPKRLFPAPRPYIQLPADVHISLREEESYSSLESLFYYPYQWVFRHKLELRKSAILSIVDPNTLKGNLAHSIFQHIFLKESIHTWKREQVEAWFKSNMYWFLKRQGATLLMYGQEPEQLQFKNKLVDAVWILIKMIQNNNWKIYGVEKNLQGRFCNIGIKGIADLVLENAQGQKCVVDMKWTSNSNKYQELIKSGEDLQLILYARLLDDDDTWAHTAYYIINRTVAYSRNNDAFKEAKALASDTNYIEVCKTIYHQMEKTLDWRIQQLQQGLIEIRTEHTAQALEQENPANVLDLLEMKKTNAKYDHFKTLINGFY
jgi:ATP-dependent helicase/nuclease subunit B